MKSIMNVNKYGTMPSASKLAAVAAKQQQASSTETQNQPSLDNNKQQQPTQESNNDKVNEFQRVFSHLRKVSSNKPTENSPPEVAEMPANNNNLDTSNPPSNTTTTAATNTNRPRLFPKTLPTMPNQQTTTNHQNIAPSNKPQTTKVNFTKPSNSDCHHNNHHGDGGSQQRRSQSVSDLDADVSSSSNNTVAATAAVSGSEHNKQHNDTNNRSVTVTPNNNNNIVANNYEIMSKSHMPIQKSNPFERLSTSRSSANNLNNSGYFLFYFNRFLF